MSPTRLFRKFLVRLLPLGVAVLTGSQVLAQADPPGRVARLNHAEGTVTFSPAGDNEWIDAVPNRPLTRGDRLWTDKGSRAEVQAGSSSVRMDGQTQLEILALDDRSAQLSVTQGTVYVRVRSLPEGENFEVDTPNLAFRAAYPGEYRVDVDGAGGTSRVTIHSGTGAVYGDSGQALPLGGGQQITFRTRSLAQVNTQESPPLDNFDRWAAERNRREDQSVSARHVPREVVGYQQLDAHGRWSQDATHGPVWFPQVTADNWAPYRHGRWDWIAPWGWTWIDDAAWGFAPSHYGRWTQLDSRWAWVPGRMGLRPVYAPALVAFIGGGASGWQLPVAAGRPGVAWFPLAPGEPWQPGYQASAAYLGSVNRGMPPLGSSQHAHQMRPDAMTAISTEDFHRGRPVRGSWLRVAANALTQAQIVPPPPMPQAPALAARERPPAARAAPPPHADVRQVAAQPTAPAAMQPPAPAKAAEQTQQAKADEQVRLARERLQGEQARARQETRPAPQAKARVPRQSERQAKRPPAQREQVARQSTKRKPVAYPQARRAPSAQRELARSEQSGRMAEVAKARRAADLEAQALRQQREQREQAQRAAWERQQQALSDQWRRDHQAWEQQQRERARQRPEGRQERRAPPEVWQRGIPILNPGRTS